MTENVTAFETHVEVVSEQDHEFSSVTIIPFASSHEDMERADEAIDDTISMISTDDLPCHAEIVLSDLALQCSKDQNDSIDYDALDNEYETSMKPLLKKSYQVIKGYQSALQALQELIQTKDSDNMLASNANESLTNVVSTLETNLEATKQVMKDSADRYAPSSI